MLPVYVYYKGQYCSGLRGKNCKPADNTDGLIVALRKVHESYIRLQNRYEIFVTGLLVRRGFMLVFISLGVLGGFLRNTC